MAVTAEILVLGNWKMHLTDAEGVTLAQSVAETASGLGAGVQVGISPPFPYLQSIGETISGSGVLLGGQDCHYQSQGAYTGDVSAPMLVDCGCDFTLVGHSERRQHHHEDNGIVFDKACAAIEQGLHTVICVGETLKQREDGSYLSLIGEQIEKALPERANRQTVSIAYEPVWAIGTGKTAGTEDIIEVHAHIRSVLGRLLGEDLPRVLYGGSVKAENALEILSLPVVDGVLVGGASLKAGAFAEIIRAASQTGS